MPAEEKAWKQLRTIFNGLDSDKNGWVDKMELESGLKEARGRGLEKFIQEAGLNTKFDVLKKLDTNRDGRICWVEFEKHLKRAATVKVQEVGVLSVALPYEAE